MKLSARGLALIADFEGFVGHGYNDAGRHCTIGYGHLLHHGRCSRAELARTISRSAAKALLDRDAERFERAVDRLVRVPLTLPACEAWSAVALDRVGAEHQLPD